MAVGLYAQPDLLDDPEYVRARCGLIVHVDDVEAHDAFEDGPCELCEEEE